MELIEQVINRQNMMRALNQVRQNKGSAGVDRMSVSELYDYLTNNRESIEQSLLNGTYLPQPILGVEIPKSNGKVRLLGVPTVVDRMLQQAVGQVLANRFEMDFEDFSYGFRPNKNAQQAVLKAQKYINSGYQDIVDIDLKSFFDEVDHCILLQLIYRRVKCPLTLRLIRKWLRAPILINGKLVKRRKGVPQGSPLSPILSNIMLDELDKELERRGLKYVRYADDFSIYCKSQWQARKIGNEIYLFLKDKLHLPINREKSGIRRPVNFIILGFGFVPMLCRQACAFGYRTLYFSMSKFLEKITVAKLEGTLLKLLSQIEKTHLLILDDFGLQPLDQTTRLTILQILEDRYGRKSTIITSQLPVASWYEYINESTIADAIMDRLSASAHRYELKGESMRKRNIK